MVSQKGHYRHPNTLLSALFGVCMLLGLGAVAAQPKAWASLQPDRIETGDTSTLLIVITGMNAIPKEVDFKPWAGVFPASNIIRKTDWRRSGTQWIRRFTLIAFDSARLELPPLLVGISAGKSLTTNGLKLQVFPTRSGSSPSDMAPIRDIRRQPDAWLDYWAWILGGVLFAILGAFFVLKNRRPKALPMPIVAAAPPPVSPSEQALAQLAQLQQAQDWKKGQLQTHYTTFSVILREYVEARFQIPALESTTFELEKMGLKQGLSPDFHRPLIQILQKIDLAKYAHIPPADSEHEALIQQARDLVRPSPLFTEQKPPNNPPKPKKRPPTTGKYEPL